MDLQGLQFPSQGGNTLLGQAEGEGHFAFAGDGGLATLKGPVALDPSEAQRLLIGLEFLTAALQRQMGTPQVGLAVG